VLCFGKAWQKKNNLLEGSQTDHNETILDELALDIKGLMLLNPSDEPLAQMLSSNIVNSADPEITRFVSLVQKKDKRSSEGGYFLIAIAEIILASILFIGGLALISPTVLGLSSPQQFSIFVTSLAQSIASQTVSNPLIPALEFIIALSLLIGAFLTLRIASGTLKQTGIPRI
jgi:hypothetical protein